MPFTPNKAFKAAPRMVAAAEGQFYIMSDGRRIRDGFCGMWCSLLGHNHPKVTEAIVRQAGMLDYSPAFNFGHEGAFQLAETIADLWPGDLNHVFFTNSGSEAVDTALKMAIAYHRIRGEGSRTRLIGRVNGYHGVGFGGISVGGMVNNRKWFGSLLGGVDHLPLPYNAELSRYTRGQANVDPMMYLKELETIIALHDASTIAAVIVEGFSGSSGVFIPPAGYLKALREITRRHGVLLILDEVITGFGRLGAANGATFFGVEPDLVTIAKGMNNAAVPMGGVVASRTIYDTFMASAPKGIEFFHGYTYSAHPLAVAAGNAAQQVFREEGVFENAASLAPDFEERMHSLRSMPFVTDVRNIGLAGGLTLESKPGEIGARGYELFLHAFEEGVAIRNNGDTIAIAPILTSSPSDIEAIFDGVQRAFRRMAA
jgi:beta-alanine--pyruvate transaminase